MGGKPKEQFYDDLVSDVAAKIASSNIMANTIVERFKKDPTVLAAVIERIDPTLVAKSLAHQIVFNSQTTRGSMANEHHIAVYKNLMKKVENQAASIVAKNITDEVKLS